MMVGEDLEVEAYGPFRSGPVPESDEHRQDLYSIFMSRATSMGWSEAVSRESTGRPLWGMADAGVEACEDDATRSTAWVHVVPLVDQIRRVGLPIQPFVQCTVDSIGRLGCSELELIRLGVPLGIHAFSRAALFGGLNWFMHVPAESAVMVGVEIAVDGTGVDSFAKGDLATALSRWHISPFAIVDGTDRKPTVYLNGGDSNPTAGQRMAVPVVETIYFRAPEWSPESVGWILAAVADTAHRLGFCRRAIISAARAT